MNSKRRSKIWRTTTEPAGSRADADGADYIEGCVGQSAVIGSISRTVIVISARPTATPNTLPEPVAAAANMNVVPLRGLAACTPGKCRGDGLLQPPIWALTSENAARQLAVRKFSGF